MLTNVGYIDVDVDVDVDVDIDVDVDVDIKIESTTSPYWKHLLAYLHLSKGFVFSLTVRQTTIITCTLTCY